MNKYLISALLVFGVLGFSVPKAKAEDLFFFQDGKGYNVQGVQKAFCLGDNNCYDINGNFLFSRVPVNTFVPTAPAPIVQPNITVVNPVLSVPVATPFEDIRNGTITCYALYVTRTWQTPGVYCSSTYTYLTANFQTLTEKVNDSVNQDYNLKGNVNVVQPGNSDQLMRYSGYNVGTYLTITYYLENNGTVVSPLETINLVN